jgi:hypothetical protein
VSVLAEQLDATGAALHPFLLAALASSPPAA